MVLDGSRSRFREPIALLEHQTGHEDTVWTPARGRDGGAGAGPGERCRTDEHGAKATIVGTRHHDVLVGTSHRDVIVAGRGDDVVSGRGGNDVICGGPGADRLTGGAGRDHLYGEEDFINHGEAEACDHGDSLDGGRGDDVLDAGRDAHADYFQGCSDRDEVRFRQGRDQGVHVDLVRGTARGQGVVEPDGPAVACR